MTPTTSQRVPKKSSSKQSRPSPSSATCKTCTPCRQKKIKCDGNRPRCLECTSGQLTCVYPQDARREPKPSRARVQNLEATVAAMLQHMRTSGIISPQVQAGDLLPDEVREQVNCDVINATPVRDCHYRHETSQDKGFAHVSATGPPLQTPSTSISAMNRQDLSPPSFPLSRFSNAQDSANFSHFEDGYMDNRDVGSRGQIRDTPDIVLSPSPQSFAAADKGSYMNTHQSQTRTVPALEKQDTPTTTSVSNGSGMSPCEARVAGAFHENGCVASVHGLASIMNPTSRAQHKENISKVSWTGEGAIAASTARLISNAALQRQREARLFRQPSSLIDLDGCDSELAWHLLELHFNRQHYAYLISYRPAIMESIANGGGPWVNKLLLNAIYYSSTLYSDRPCLRSDPHDPTSIGGNFYARFRHLLVDEIDKPNIPTVMALLLTSATLVSQGRSSAGWNLSGMAYRMLIDMGCHLMLGPDYQSNLDHGQLLRRDLEQEMRRRLYWGAFVTDATQSLYLGRPCMFASTEARVPLHFLDTFEELEQWEPYIDQQSSSSTHIVPPAYMPQPAYALSTFSWLARLFQISTHITDLYGIQVIECSSDYLQERKTAIENKLETWKTSLPAHLRFDPDGSFVPPPHQITPHTTFHALNILLHRAFLEEGHLRRHCDEAGRRQCEEACITSALAIQKLVSAYRKAFTLRRAPFLLSYAVYSAVIVILRQERHERGQFTEPISFFWTSLRELQRGCNFGLEKPLTILRDMVEEFQVSHRDGAVAGGVASSEIPQLANLNETFFPLPLGQQQMATDGDAAVLDAPIQAEQDRAMYNDYMGAMDQPDLSFGMPSPGFLVSLNQMENDISGDTLYGLFAAPQGLPKH